jgi:hypothetical protein
MFGAISIRQVLFQYSIIDCPIFIQTLLGYFVLASALVVAQIQASTLRLPLQSVQVILTHVIDFCHLPSNPPFLSSGGLRLTKWAEWLCIFGPKALGSVPVKREGQPAQLELSSKRASACKFSCLEDSC